jgi:hypothetical protein
MFPLNMVIFHSFLYVYQRVRGRISPSRNWDLPHRPLFWSRGDFTTNQAIVGYKQRDIFFVQSSMNHYTRIDTYSCKNVISYMLHMAHMCIYFNAFVTYICIESIYIYIIYIFDYFCMCVYMFPDARSHVNVWSISGCRWRCVEIVSLDVQHFRLNGLALDVSFVSNDKHPHGFNLFQHGHSSTVSASKATNSPLYKTHVQLQTRYFSTKI